MEDSDKTPTEATIQIVIRLIYAVHELVQALIAAIEQVDLFSGAQKVKFLQALRQDCDSLLELVAAVKDTLRALTFAETVG